MARRRLAVLVAMVALPLAACSAGSATAARPAYPYACKIFRTWFSYVGGNVASHRSGADSLLTAAQTMSFSGKLHRDLARVQSYAVRTRTARSASTLAAGRSMTLTAVRRVQAYCR
jgi:hypothetical protein